MLKIDGYQILVPIYESNNSIVYRGVQQADNQPVILKILKQDYPSPTEITHYRQEYEIVCNLNLQGVVKAYCLLEVHRTLVIVFEDFGGQSLKQLMNDAHNPIFVGKRQIKAFLKFAIQVAEILGQIHSRNIIHKDINPANILLNVETGQVKIIDFGISSQLTHENPTLKNPNVLEGTLAYMSPEQTGRMNRSLDYRTDFYSLGISFYELLTGKRPFDTTDALELIHCHIAKVPMSVHQVNPDIPKAVSDIVLKLMAKTAEERYQSAWGLKADLEECLNQLQRQGKISNFSLASQDISDKFQIPQKLYGREAEVEVLLAAFARVSGQKQPATNKSEMMLVAGYCGIGKSALVAEIHKPNAQLHGYFTSGKFDQFQRNIPYSALVSAFTGLVRQLLTESEAQLNVWREKLLAALGSNSQVIIDVIPEVELIVGKQVAVPDLGTQECQNRFNLVFQNFIRVFCSKKHPLVIFLDDLQWADSATLQLLKLIMTDKEMQYLFLIGAYRNNEVSTTHPLIMTIEDLRKQGATVNQITLAPLQLKHIIDLIADTLHSDSDSVKPLAQLVARKTGGNPFFVNQFLQTLYAENLLKFIPPQSLLKGGSKGGVWQWDLNQIEAMGITDNVVELMISKLKKLPVSTQQILRLAACIGAYFDLNTLSIVCENKKETIFSDLVVAVQAGLILPVSELDSQLLIQDYKFLHDRVQQAAYALIEQEQKKTIHLQIGRLLWQNNEADALIEQVFDIVDHLNIGIELVTSQAERNEIARLNLLAGQKAKAAAAYAAAKKYLAIGVECLNNKSWNDGNYKLLFALSKDLAECEYLLGCFEEAENTFDVLLKNTRTRLDKAEVYSLRELLYDGLNKYEETIQAGRSGLALFGINFPDLNEPEIIQDLIKAELQAYKINLANRKPKELLLLPEMTDCAQRACINLLLNMTIPAYFVNESILTWVVIKMVNICIVYGNTDISSLAYTWFAAILCSQFDDYQVGYEYGCLGLELRKLYNNAKLHSRNTATFCFFVNHWLKPLKTNISMFKETFQVGLETGDMMYATNALYGLIRDMLLSGENLDITLAECDKTIDFMIRNKNQGFMYLQQMFRHVILMLKGDIADYCHLYSKETNEEEWVTAWLDMQFMTAISHLKIYKMWALYILEENLEVVKLFEENKKFIIYSKGQPQIVESYFCHTLALITLYSEQSITEKQQNLEVIKANQQRIKLWADNCPDNFLHKYLLVEAEIGRITNRDLAEVMSLYDRAIESARENEFIHNEALANELAAKFWLARSKVEFAQPYMTKARYCYERWGAKRKVRDLEEKYPQLLPKGSAVTTVTTTRTSSLSVSTDTDSGAALDLATVIKASQAIGSEIVLEQLLRNLMKILLENAGAQIGFLLLESNGQMLIEAEGAVDADVTVLQSIPIENHLPVSLINYVARTYESIILNDATVEGKLSNDPYIQSRKPKSILCVPLINQGQLISIVYLENNYTTGAFTPARLEVLKILSSQATISIENARLYQTLEDKVKERTAQLAEANAEITVLNEKLKAENLRMSAELDVTRQLQQMILPKQEELAAIEGLDLAGFMESANEVGGDYYDVLYQDSVTTIGIGDVTGHGLESGILMVMTQTAVRTLKATREIDPVRFLDILNRVIYNNVQRMNSDKNLTLAILNYSEGKLSLSGQHEEMIVVRSNGEVERVDTIDLGFPIGLDYEIADFIHHTNVDLNPGDGVVLYTDGITEAEDINNKQYGLERLCEVASRNWQHSAEDIKNAVIKDVRQHIGEQRVFDDITLLILKQK